ncbi:MAG: hypothetical protein J0L69_15480 [Bacteroidetes bacterium]|nr:hypothetical protein [Bacteroidota bacterium]
MTLNDSIAMYFDETKRACTSNEKLWDKNIYGPLLIVDPISRKAYANEPDTLGILKPDGKIFIGKLPYNVVIANANVKWSGKNWAMVLLPFISKVKEDRINLLAHELFHRSQLSLGFENKDANNNHLDTKNGRVYLRLELNALIKALESKSKKEAARHLNNAVLFRKHRHALFPGADSTENAMELNEGLAEYTGTYISRGSLKEATPNLIRKIKDFQNGGTFVRTFPYRTIPVYGFFLQETKKYWNKEIKMSTPLTEYFVWELKLSIPDDIAKIVLQISKEYDFDSVNAQETEREEKTKALLNEYRKKFIELPHLTITFENKKSSFDSRNLTPLDDKGVVYPTMTVSDNWGVLTIDKVGGLMSPNRDKVTITAPKNIDGLNITGEGWTIKLTEGYQVLKSNDGSENYILQKK